MISLQTKTAKTVGANYYTEKTCCWLVIICNDERATNMYLFYVKFLNICQIKEKCLCYVAVAC